MVRMTLEAINFCIKRKDLIKNPHLNEKLYLSNQGFSSIENLHSFKQVKALFLSRNSIYRITNLEPLQELKDLNLSNNKIGEQLLFGSSFM
jgi:Leucine-rich repeat (LRR) protein